MLLLFSNSFSNDLGLDGRDKSKKSLGLSNEN